MNKKVHVVLFLCGIATSSLAMADCPITMPEQLIEDCIVNENAGHSFPPSDYVYMDMYQEWVKAQQTEKMKIVAKSEMK